jgi:hypothetical protein
MLVLAVASCLSLLVSVWGEALSARMLGRVGGVISRWCLAYIRVGLKTGSGDHRGELALRLAFLAGMGSCRSPRSSFRARPR